MFGNCEKVVIKEKVTNVREYDQNITFKRPFPLTQRRKGTRRVAKDYSPSLSLGIGIHRIQIVLVSHQRHIENSNSTKEIFINQSTIE